MESSLKAIIGLRIIEILFAIIAITTASSGKTDSCSFSGEALDSSSEVNFLIANGVLVFIILPVWTYYIEYKDIKLPGHYIPFAMDLFWCLMCLSCASTVAASTVINDVCNEPSVKNSIEIFCHIGCSSLKSSVVFTFLMLFAFIGSGFLTYRRVSAQGDKMNTPAIEYLENGTPRSSVPNPGVGSVAL